MGMWSELRKMDARKIAESWENDFRTGKDPLVKFKPDLNDAYSKIRSDIMEMFDETLEKYKFGYEFDAELGLRLFTYFTDNGMTEADAANDDIWRFIQMKVVPDIICRRWPFKDNKFNDKRFWSAPGRLYLKVIWWYLNIIWAGSEDETREYMSSLDISQITDRSGKRGTRIAVYKEILHVFSSIDPSKRTGLIDRVLMLNDSYCSVMEPELMDCTLHEYAVGLYRELGIDV